MHAKDPLASDLILSLTHDGIRLLFDSVTQRLRVIEIFKMNLTKLKYWYVSTTFFKFYFRRKHHL